MLTIKEAALKLGVHWQSIRNYIERGELKSHKIGKLIRIDEDDLQRFIDNEKALENDDFEIETRYTVENTSEIEQKLLGLGAKVQDHSHIIDHYYIPKNLKSRAEHDRWFDEELGAAIRIREEDHSYSGDVVAYFQVKRLTELKDHNTVIEAGVKIESFEKIKKVLSLLDHREFLTIDKSRLLYVIGDFQVEIDQIEGYGAGLNIEIKNQKSRNDAIKRLHEFAENIGLHDNQKCKHSVTRLAMDRLAKF